MSQIRWGNLTAIAAVSGMFIYWFGARAFAATALLLLLLLMLLAIVGVGED